MKFTLSFDCFLNCIKNETFQNDFKFKFFCPMYNDWFRFYSVNRLFVCVCVFVPVGWLLNSMQIFSNLCLIIKVFLFFLYSLLNITDIHFSFNEKNPLTLKLIKPIIFSAADWLQTNFIFVLPVFTDHRIFQLNNAFPLKIGKWNLMKQLTFGNYFTIAIQLIKLKFSIPTKMKI